MAAKEEIAWAELSQNAKIKLVVVGAARLVAVLSLLYLFIISLGMMGSAFTILGGPTAGEVFRNSEIFDNPIAGLVIGILATVLVQSSSTSTSIIITMTAAGLMKVKNAIPMIMGANIGTSVTNTIVSMAQMGNKAQYRRAFGGATVHDCFNLLTVAILLPVEVITGLLRHIAEALVEAFGIDSETEKQSKVDFLKKITSPATNAIVSVDKKLITKVAESATQAERDALLEKSMIVQSKSKDTHLFSDTPMSDEAAGWLLLIISLVALTTCLILIVQVLQATFKGRAAQWVKALLNLEFKSVPFLADYVLIVAGAVITILMQSSSITTSALTPLVGIGLITLEKMFPFTVGANIGTTITGILSALAGSSISIGMTVALAHLLFNLFGAAIWFPVPVVRGVPLSMARFLGNLAADWRSFPLWYIFTVFGIVPMVLLGLSLAGTVALCLVGIPLLMLLLATVTILAMRKMRPDKLPEQLKRDPNWLPPSMRIAAPEGKDVEEEEEAAEQQGPGAWELAPFAWGVGWMILGLLIMAIPNSQWAKSRYPTFDSRARVGIGAFQVCSAMYEADQVWASPRPACTASMVASCSQLSCVADKAGANTIFEASWNNCTSFCSTVEWRDHCLSLGCGSAHEAQCRNLTEAVTRDYQVTYHSGDAGQLAWTKGDRCRDVDTFCDVGSQLQASGGLAITGTVLQFLGQAALLASRFLSSSQTQALVLASSLGLFLVGFVFLLIACIVFEGTVGSEATCVVIDDTSSGAITATGTLNEIIGSSGSYSLLFVFLAALLSVPVMAAIGARVLQLRRSKDAEAGAGGAAATAA